MTELKLLVKDCDYANGEEMVSDRIVFATNSPRVREKLLSHGPELTLEKAIARSYELAQVQLKTMANSSHEVHLIHHKTRKPGTARSSNRPNESPKTTNKACTACGGHHDKLTECPVKGKQCLKCQKI